MPTTPAATPRRRSAKKVTLDAANDMTTGSGPSSADASTPYLPSYEEIAEAAYHRYLSRGGNHGQDFEDWLEAERELRSRR